MLIKVASTINLSAIAGTVKACGEHLGLLKICLKAAKERDPNNYGLQASVILEHIKSRKLSGTKKPENEGKSISPEKRSRISEDNSSETVDDETARTSLETRWACYQVAIECLDDLFTTLEEANQKNNKKLNISSNMNTSIDSLEAGQSKNFDPILQRKVDDIWRFCLQSKDQLWHYALYDFLISSDIHRKRLTRLDTPFIQNWFDYAAHVAPETNAMLYAEWLEAVQRYSDAAKTLYKLAILDSSMDSEFDLVKRIQILCKALTDAKASSNSELVEQISDRLDVAELQQVIVRILKSKCEANPELLGEYAQGLQVAQQKLISLSDLYRAFGEAQNMPEIQLLVLHCAGQGNAEIIEHLWRTSIDQCLHDDQGWKFDCGDAEACVSAIREKVLFLSRTFLTSRSSAQNIESLRKTSNYIGKVCFWRDL